LKRNENEEEEKIRKKRRKKDRIKKKQKRKKERKKAPTVPGKAGSVSSGSTRTWSSSPSFNSPLFVITTGTFGLCEFST
jgi:hypothetical protein